MKIGLLVGIVILGVSMPSSFSASSSVRPRAVKYNPLTAPLSNFFKGPITEPTETLREWRDTICAHETRNMAEKERDDAISPMRAIGRCQVLPETARSMLGFVGPTYAMFFPRVSEELGDRMVARCLNRRGWKNSLKAVAHCFLGGPRRKYIVDSEWYWYAVNVERLWTKRATLGDDY